VVFIVLFTRVLRGTCDGRVLSRTADGVIVWTLNNTAAYIVSLSYSASPSNFTSKLDRALRSLSFSFISYNHHAGNVFDALWTVLQKARLSGLFHQS